MRIEGIWGNGETGGLLGGGPRNVVGADDVSKVPESWGSDSVSISPEALAALRESRESNTGQEESSGAEEPDAGAEFKAYMAKKRSRVQGPEDLEEMIERLKEKAAEISKKIEQVARDTSISEIEREAKLQTLNNQLQKIQTQINDLENELRTFKMAKEKELLAEGLEKGGGSFGSLLTQGSRGGAGGGVPDAAGRPGGLRDAWLFETES